MFSRFAVCTLIFLALASPADADEAETVVVTASRVPIEADQSGSAVTVLMGDTLRARDIDQLYDALRTVPGVEVSRTGTVGSFAQIRIRGAEAGHELVLIDGARVNDPAASSEGFNFAHMLTAAIGRVEVLRGPQSALWGADALAGVVNIVTVAPHDGFDVSGRAEYGSFDTKEVSGLVNIGDDRYAAIFDGAWLDTDGINIAHNGHEDDGYRNTSFGMRAKADVSDTFHLSAAIHRVDTRTDIEATDFLGTFSIPLDAGDYSDFSATYGRAQASLMLFDGVLETIAGASFTRTKVNDFTSPFGAPFDVSFNDRTEGGENRFDLQTNIRWSPNQRLSLLAETVRDTFDSIRLDLPSASQSQHETHSGVAAEYWIGIDDAVFVSLGARHDWNEVFADTTTWRATVSARLDPAVRLHASAGTGVKNPDFFELFGFFPAPAFEGNPNLKPEKSLGFDGGLEWRVAPDVIVDATYFHTDLEDEIFTDFSVFPNTARNASGESLRQGVEVSAHAKLIDGLTLDAAYTYLDAKENGAPEIRRPHHIASANLDWRFAEDRGLINLGIDYHGRQRDTAFLNAPPFTMPVTLDRYTLVHLAGSYEICPGFALTARVENALDVSYEEVFGYRTQGFGAFAGVKVRFGG